MFESRCIVSWQKYIKNTNFRRKQLTSEPKFFCCFFLYYYDEYFRSNTILINACILFSFSSHSSGKIVVLFYRLPSDKHAFCVVFVLDSKSEMKRKKKLTLILHRTPKVQHDRRYDCSWSVDGCEWSSLEGREKLASYKTYSTNTCALVLYFCIFIFFKNFFSLFYTAPSSPPSTATPKCFWFNFIRYVGGFYTQFFLFFQFEFCFFNFFCILLIVYDFCFLTKTFGGKLDSNLILVLENNFCRFFFCSFWFIFGCF